MESHWQTACAPPPWMKWLAKGTCWRPTGAAQHRGQWQPAQYDLLWPFGSGQDHRRPNHRRKAGKRLHKLNGTTASTADIKGVGGGMDTFADSQRGGALPGRDPVPQQRNSSRPFLEFIENGSITLIASTTENPYFYVYNAILSRSTVFGIPAGGAPRGGKAVGRASPGGEIYGAGIRREEGVEKHIAFGLRRGCARPSTRWKSSPSPPCGEGGAGSHFRGGPGGIPAVPPCGTTGMGMSTIISYRRSRNPSAGRMKTPPLHYLARLLTAGDLCPPPPGLVTAAEDIGLAYPQAIPIVKACVDSALQLGLPEARHPLGGRGDPFMHRAQVQLGHLGH